MSQIKQRRMQLQIVVLCALQLFSVNAAHSYYARNAATGVTKTFGWSAQPQHGSTGYSTQLRNAPILDPMTHYTKANALSMSGKKEEALDEYRIALGLTKDPKLREYCTQAIAAWTRPKTKVDVAITDIETQAKSLGDSKQLSDSPYGFDANFEKSTPQEIQQAIEKTEREREIQVTNYYSSTSDPGISRQRDVSRTESYYNQKIAYLKSLLEQRAFNQQVQALQNEVQNSQSSTGLSPKINPIGTNLYIRNYADLKKSQPRNEEDELIAAQDKLIVDSHSRTGKTITRITREQIPEQKPQPNSDLKVHGQLIPSNPAKP